MADIPVSLEVTINKTFHEAAKSIFNNHGVRIDTVQFNYQIIESMGERPQAARVSVKMATTYMPEGEI